MKKTLPSLALLLAVAACLTALIPDQARPLQAKEELVTLPARDAVTLTIYDPVDLTFVQEERVLSFNAGKNTLQFSWANTLIDPSSVTFAAQSANAGLELLDTSFPAQSNTMLEWTVEAEEAGNYGVRITYFTTGISWKASYRAVLNPAADQLQLTGFASVQNRSGEDYENARVRLVIGQINLVEKIRELSQGKQWRELEEYLDESDAEGAAPNSPRRGGAPMENAKRAKRVVKESVGEYFIYTIEGTETVPQGWSKRLVAIKPVDVKVSQLYVFNPKEFGSYALLRTLNFYNTEEHSLGAEPLPAGQVHCYQSANNGRLAFVGTTSAEYLPIGDEAKWQLGADPLVTFERTMMAERRENLTFTRNRNQSWLTGHDVEQDWRIRIKNMRDGPIKVEYHERQVSDAVSFEQLSEGAEVEDATTFKWTFDMAASSTRDIAFTLRTKNGRNYR